MKLDGPQHLHSQENPIFNSGNPQYAHTVQHLSVRWGTGL